MDMDLLRCSKCKMRFDSSSLLEKHKEKFCIGGDFGKTNLISIERKMDYRTRQQERSQQQQQSHEKEIMLDVKAPETKAQDKSKDPDPNLDLNPVQGRKPNGKLLGYRTNAPWTHDQDSRMRNLAELHEKHILDLETENRQLEEQRREIDLQLQELAAQSKGVSRVEDMLHVLQTQEQRNALLLESLVEQLQRVQMGSIKDNTQSRHSDSHQYSAKKKKKEFIPSHTYIPLNGKGTLSSEISALRLSYLQSGGNDHLILAQLEDLLIEALEVEMHHDKQPRSRHHHRDRSGKDREKIQLKRDLLAAELENRQLEEAIMTIQLGKWRNLQLSRMTYNGQSSERKMKPLRADLELLRQEMEMNRLRQQRKAKTVPPPLSVLPPLEDVRFHTPTLGKHLMGFSDDLGPAPYDPVAGFVVFYDFLLGLPLLYGVCRLVVRLYTGEQEMGSPTPLPMVYCEPASLSQRVSKHRRGNSVTFATKQAVPRVLPSPAVSLVLEVQALEGYDRFGEEVKHLVSRGWVKLDLFDSHNRVITGKWKVPVRAPPIRPSMTTGELNTVPQLDSAELYLRIGNSRDAEVQSSIPISHSNAWLYKYPSPVSIRNQLASGDSVQSSRFSQIPHTNPQFPAYFESVDHSAPSGAPREQE